MGTQYYNVNVMNCDYVYIHWIVSYTGFVDCK